MALVWLRVPWQLHWHWRANSSAPSRSRRGTWTQLHGRESAH